MCFSYFVHVLTLDHLHNKIKALSDLFGVCVRRYSVCVCVRASPSDPPVHLEEE